MKVIIKEVFIILLLCVAIFLLMAFIFYNQLTMGGDIPENVAAYTTPAEIKEEITQDIAQYPMQNVSFEITDSDLTIYRRSKSYDPGKKDPFSDAALGTTSTIIKSGSGNTSSDSTDDTSKSGSSSVFDTKIK